MAAAAATAVWTLLRAAAGVVAIVLAANVYSWIRTLIARRRERAMVGGFVHGLQPAALFLHTKGVLVIINPIGGLEDGVRILNEVALPMLRATGTRAHAVVTAHGGHAREIARDYAGLGSAIAAIICIGGDGMLHEIINGLADRVRGDEAALAALLARCPLGLVPAGTSNGLSTSLGARTPFEALRRILLGGPAALDLSRIELVRAAGQRQVVLDGFAFSYGIGADHDALQERRLRWLPKRLRELVAPAVVILRCRAYPARLHMRLVRPVPSGLSDPALAEASPMGADWVVIDSDLVLCSGIQVAWASYDVQLAPGLVPGSGAVDLCVIRGGVSRLALARVFMGMDDGRHVREPSFERYRVSAYRLELPAEPEGLFSCAGEHYNIAGAVTVTVLPGALHVLCSASD